MHEWELSIRNGTFLCVNGKSPFMESSIPASLDPPGLAGMDGAVASLRHDAFECDDGRRAASASVIRPASACYRVREVLPPSH
jgi:hypothetical protein